MIDPPHINAERLSKRVEERSRAVETLNRRTFRTRWWSVPGAAFMGAMFGALLPKYWPSGAAHLIGAVAGGALYLAWHAYIEIYSLRQRLEALIVLRNTDSLDTRT